MSENKVEFGLEQVHIAFLDESGATMDWEEPIAIPGAVRFAPSPQGNESKFYADNGLYYSGVTNDGYTAEIEMARFPDTVLARMFGWLIDDNGMLVEVTDGEPKEFAVMAQIEGDKKPRRFVYYKCKAARRAKERTTRGESIDVKTDVMPLVITPITTKINGENKRVVKGTIEKNSLNNEVYEKFFDAVTRPNAIPVALDKAALTATVAIAGVLDENDWDDTSWIALTNVLTAANTALLSASTQRELNEANNNLQNAILALVPNLE